MTRLLTCGWELGAATTADAPTGVFDNQAASTTVSTIVRSGGFARKLNGSTSGNVAGFQAAGVLSNVYYQRLAVYLGTGFNTGFYPIQIWETTGGLGADIVCDSGGNLQLQAYSTGTPIGSNKALTFNIWHVVEMSWQPSTGAATMQVDGVTIASGTADVGSSAANIAFEYNEPSTSTAQPLYIDDWAVNDNTGTACNSWCGPGQVIVLKPTADSSRVGFTTGAAGTTSLFACVNHGPPTGVVQTSATATSQIEDNVSNTTDNYVATLATYTAAGVSTGASIILAQPVAVVGNSVATARNAGIATTNPTIAETTAATPGAIAGTYPSNWKTILGTLTYSPTPTLGTAPTMTFRKATASTNYLMACFMGLMVEWLPVVATPQALTASAAAAAQASLATTAPSVLAPTAQTAAQAVAAATTPTFAIRQLGNPTITSIEHLHLDGLDHSKQIGNSITIASLNPRPIGQIHARQQGNPTLSARTLPAGIAHTRAQGHVGVNDLTLAPAGITRT